MLGVAMGHSQMSVSEEADWGEKRDFLALEECGSLLPLRNRAWGCLFAAVQ